MSASAAPESFPPSFNEITCVISKDQVAELFSLAADRGISCSLHYEDGSRSWYVTLFSSAPVECFVGKSGTLSISLETAIGFLKTL